MMSVLHVEIREEDDFQPSGNIRIVVYHLGNRIDQLDDQLRHKVARRGLSAEDKGAGDNLLSGVFFDAIIQA